VSDATLPTGQIIKGDALEWEESHRADPRVLPMADRHYSRQKPGTPQFVPPGACYVLKRPGALWVTSWPRAEYVKHAWAGAWVNTMFRREYGPVASEPIIAAVAVTRWKWPDVPALGIVSFVNAGKVRRKRDPGRCYRKAGFRHVGFTQGGLWVYQMLPSGMPGPVKPFGVLI